MLLNLSCCYLRKNDPVSATETLSKAVNSDPHLALGFFMLGLTQYIQEKYDESLQSFDKTFTLLRGNKFVDYRQLGFKYQLYSAEVLTNLAAVHLKLNNIDKAKTSLQQAFENKAEKRHERIFDAIQEINTGKPIRLFVPPRSEIFRPSKAAVANIKKKDYLGTAKVISTDSEEDCYACFSGIKDKVIEQKRAEAEDKKKSEDISKTKPSPKIIATQQVVTPPSPPPPAESPKTSDKPRPVSMAPPKSPLPPGPTSLDSVDAAPVRSSSVGARPNKPLPQFVQPTKPLPVLDVTCVDSESQNVEAEPPTTNDVIEATVTQQDGSEEVEIEIQYNFISKVRLPKGFTLADLQNVAIQQTIPKQVELRTSDSLGRQRAVTDADLKALPENPIQCFPSSL